jgi:hypothetical protein
MPLFSAFLSCPVIINTLSLQPKGKYMTTNLYKLFSACLALAGLIAIFPLVSIASARTSSRNQNVAITFSSQTQKEMVEYYTKVFRSKYSSHVKPLQVTVWDLGFTAETAPIVEPWKYCGRPDNRAIILLNTNSAASNLVVVTCLTWAYSDLKAPTAQSMDKNLRNELIKAGQKGKQVQGQVGKDLALLTNPELTREQVQSFDVGIQYNARSVGSVTEVLFDDPPYGHIRLWIDSDGMAIHDIWRQVLFVD